MKSEVKWGYFTRPDGKKFRQIEIDCEPNWDKFEVIAKDLIKNLKGKWINKIDGLDQRYWDLSINGIELTLHFEHYLGITLYYKDGNDDDPQHLLDRAYSLLTK